MIYSFSAINTFKKCPQQYKLKYLDKIKVEGAHFPALEKGRKVHSLIEQRTSGQDQEVDYALSHLPTGKSAKKRVVISRMKFKPLVQVDTDGNKYFDAQEQKFAFDERLQIQEFDSPNALFRGIIDYYAVYLNLNGGQKLSEVFDRILLIDWKTGKWRVDCHQLNLYSVYLSLVFPKIPITAKIVNTRVRRKKEWEITKEVQEKALEKLVADINRIEAAIEDQNFPCTSFLCDWCEFPDYCPGSPGKNRSRVLAQKSDPFASL